MQLSCDDNYIWLFCHLIQFYESLKCNKIMIQEKESDNITLGLFICIQYYMHFAMLVICAII